jgi:hypothetical protein
MPSFGKLGTWMGFSLSLSRMGEGLKDIARQDRDAAVAYAASLGSLMEDGTYRCATATQPLSADSTRIDFVLIIADGIPPESVRNIDPGFIRQYAATLLEVHGVCDWIFFLTLRSTPPPDPPGEATAIEEECKEPSPEDERDEFLNHLAIPLVEAALLNQTADSDLWNAAIAVLSEPEALHAMRWHRAQHLVSLTQRRAGLDAGDQLQIQNADFDVARHGMGPLNVLARLLFFDHAVRLGRMLLQPRPAVSASASSSSIPPIPSAILPQRPMVVSSSPTPISGLEGLPPFDLNNFKLPPVGTPPLSSMPSLEPSWPQNPEPQRCALASSSASSSSSCGSGTRRTIPPQMRAIQQLSSSATMLLGRVLAQLSTITTKLDTLQRSVDTLDARVTHRDVAL